MLSKAKRVLLAGCGGGCDVYSTLPIYHHLASLGIDCYFFNISFASLEDITNTEAIPLLPEVPFLRNALPRNLLVVKPDSSISDKDYFPERALAEFLEKYPPTPESPAKPVYTLHQSNSGVATVSAAFKFMIEKHDIDAVVTIDAGTDSLMAGNEEGLGSYTEDFASILAGQTCSAPIRIHCALGLGVDSHHGVSDVSSLRAIAELRKVPDGYLGAVTLLPTMQGFLYYKQGVEFAMTRDVDQTITNCAVIESTLGVFGSEFRAKTKSAWLNPQLSVIHGFSLDAVIGRIFPPLVEHSLATIGFEDLYQQIHDQVKKMAEWGLLKKREEYPPVPHPEQPKPHVKEQKLWEDFFVNK